MPSQYGHASSTVGPTTSRGANTRVLLTEPSADRLDRGDSAMVTPLCSPDLPAVGALHIGALAAAAVHVAHAPARCAHVVVGRLAEGGAVDAARSGCGVHALLLIWCANGPAKIAGP